MECECPDLFFFVNPQIRADIYSLLSQLRNRSADHRSLDRSDRTKIHLHFQPHVLRPDILAARSEGEPVDPVRFFASQKLIAFGDQNNIAQILIGRGILGMFGSVGTILVSRFFAPGPIVST